MKNLHITNSYKVWLIKSMQKEIKNVAKLNYNSDDPEILLNRSYRSMYIEWWLHNIGYYITRPFCHIGAIHKVNLRFKDVDLEEWIDKTKLNSANKGVNNEKISKRKNNFRYYTNRRQG